MNINTKIPRIAVIGKPNVGKSTLINRICNNREAIVHSEPMITRDRKYHEAEWNGKKFYLLDTGGIDMKSEDKLALQIFMQTKKAIDESDLILFIVDIKEPPTPMDYEITDILRKSNKKFLFVGNKWDNIKNDYNIDEYLKFGFGYPIKISASHGLNTGDLLDEIIKEIDVPGHEYKHDETVEDIPNISILGKPNVGKSTLFNKIINEERVIVDEMEGTTRDTIDCVISYKNKSYRFIDTAGMKKKKIVEKELDYYSKLRTLKAIERSEISLILIDSMDDITKQDIRISEMCIDKGTSICILFNKIDSVDSENLDKIIDKLDRKLEFLNYVPFLKISALKDKSFNEVFKMIDMLLEERSKKIPDNKLNNLFKSKSDKSFIYSGSKKFKIKFIKQIRVSPPGFIIFSNMDVSKKNNIKKFIENNLREAFGFVGAPIFFKYKY